MRFHVTLDDRLPMTPVSGGGMSYGYCNPTVVLVEADEVKVTDHGDLVFSLDKFQPVGEFTAVAREPIECFARGQWTRWKRIE
jgi:hypothetical protein